MAQSYFSPRQRPHSPSDSLYIFPSPSSSPHSPEPSSPFSSLDSGNLTEWCPTRDAELACSPSITPLTDSADDDPSADIWSWVSDVDSVAGLDGGQGERVSRWESLAYRRRMARAQRPHSTSRLRIECAHLVSGSDSLRGYTR